MLTGAGHLRRPLSVAAVGYARPLEELAVHSLGAVPSAAVCAASWTTFPRSPTAVLRAARALA